MEKFTLYFNEEKGEVTIQEADYVEDGHIVRINEIGNVSIIEIPMGGGEEIPIAYSCNIVETLRYLKRITP